jgi:hypothetical protein
MSEVVLPPSQSVLRATRLVEEAVRRALDAYFTCVKKIGKYVCFDVHPFRTTKVQHWLAHLDNSRRTFLKLLDKARSFDEARAQRLIAERDHQELDEMALEHLMGR